MTTRQHTAQDETLRIAEEFHAIRRADLVAVLMARRDCSRTAAYNTLNRATRRGSLVVTEGRVYLPARAPKGPTAMNPFARNVMERAFDTQPEMAAAVRPDDTPGELPPLPACETMEWHVESTRGTLKLTMPCVDVRHAYDVRRTLEAETGGRWRAVGKPRSAADPQERNPFWLPDDRPPKVGSGT